MSTDRETWGNYSKLVLKELERLNDNYEKMREDIDIRFKEMNTVLTEFKNTEKVVSDQKNWIEKYHYYLIDGNPIKIKCFVLKAKNIKI